MSVNVRKIDTDIELLRAMVRSYPLDWGIVYANPRCERRAFMGLIEGGVMAYLPEEQFLRKQPRSKKKITVRKPVFSRYLFAGIDRAAGQDWASVRACDGVEGLVSLDGTGKPFTLSREEMDDLIGRLSTGEKIADGSYIKIGETFGLIKGPFSGFDVKITAYAAGADKFRGEVAILGRSTPVTASVDDLGR